MTGKTHRAGGMLVSVVGFEVLRQQGLLLPDVHQGLQWLVMYPFVMWGSVASDLDHHWQSCPSKDYPSWCINKLLHIGKPLEELTEHNEQGVLHKTGKLLNAHHRSFQTHSDITLYLVLALLFYLAGGENTLVNLGNMDRAIGTLVLFGLGMGILAHLVLDMLTPEGIWVSILVVANKLTPKHIRIPEKLHFVPHSSFFATGGTWEIFIQKLLTFLTVVSLLWLGYILSSPYVEQVAKVVSSIQ